MRTSGLSLGAIAFAIAVAVPSPATAQRTHHRSVRRFATPAPRRADARSCSSDCGGYSLAVVSALLPVATPGSSSEIATLVIENRGSAAAPVSLVSVAPQNHLAAARQSAIPALAPGQRATVQLPVETGPDGTRCISITISSIPVNDPAAAQFLAAAVPQSNNGTAATATLPAWSALPEAPYWPDWPVAALLSDDREFVNLGDSSPFAASGAA